MKNSTEGAPTSGRTDVAATPTLKRLRTVAVILLALAIGCSALALWARQRQNLVQGPWGLAVLPGGQIWLSVDDQLWRLDTEGRRQQQVSAAQAGLPRAAAILMPHPDGYLAAWSRFSAKLHLLAADDARPVTTLTPQWPDDLARHGDNAIHFAFAPDGRVAIATGGGHTVALFDAHGRYLARSPAGTFRFTNGLWWADGGWWCTDTNRWALVRLDDARLTETQRVKLKNPQSGWPLLDLLQDLQGSSWRFLGMAAASRGAVVDGQKPLGMVERLANDMERGHIVDVWPDGSQRAYPIPEGQSALEARALAWLDDTLLVVNGQDFTIRRYSADRGQLADWGDAEVRSDLAQRHATFESWHRWYHASLAVAVALFLLGLIAALRARRLERRAKLAQYAPDLPANKKLGIPSMQAIAPRPQAPLPADGKLGIPGMPMLSNNELVSRRMRATWPVFLMAGVISAWPTGLKIFTKSAHSEHLPFAAVLLSALSLAALAWLTWWWVMRRLARTLANDEPFANAPALQKLARPGLFWPLRQPGELPRETLMLRESNRWSWLVLTNQRLLVFRSDVFNTRLQRSVPHGAVRAQLVPLEQMPWWQRWLYQMVVSQGRLRLALADGSVIAGAVLCVQAARRLVTSINQPAVPTAFGVGDVPRETPFVQRRADVPQQPRTERPETPDERRRVRWQTLASLLIPGLGQWMQDRFGSGLLFFVVWLVLMGQFVFVAWVAWMPIMEVWPIILWLSGLMALMVHLGAAYHASRLRGAHRA